MSDTTGLLTRLLHEMIHVYNFRKGVIDCRANQYHNKAFLVVAIKVGLICVPHRSQGWVTTLETSDPEAVTPTAMAVQKRIKAFNEVKLIVEFYGEPRYILAI